jgi:hypothetical protein
MKCRDIEGYRIVGVFGLSYEDGLGDCTAEAPRTLSKEVFD